MLNPSPNEAIVAPATESLSQLDKQSIPTGAIIGVCVGVAAFGVCILVAGVLAYRRIVRNQQDIWAQQLSLIDLQSINIGEAKSSIVSGSIIFWIIYVW